MGRNGLKETGDGARDKVEGWGRGGGEMIDGSRSHFDYSSCVCAFGGLYYSVEAHFFSLQRLIAYDSSLIETGGTPVTAWAAGGAVDMTPPVRLYHY